MEIFGGVMMLLVAGVVFAMRDADLSYFRLGWGPEGSKDGKVRRWAVLVAVVAACLGTATIIAALV